MLDVQDRVFGVRLPDESQFVQTEGYDQEGESGSYGVYRIVVHPWVRDYSNFQPGRVDREVFIAVGNLTPDGQQDIDAEDGSYANIIVDRDEFVEGLLAVFPELTRKEQ